MYTRIFFVLSILCLTMSIPTEHFYSWEIGKAHGHEWYDRSCCSGQDCRPVLCTDLKYNLVTKSWSYKGMEFSGTMIKPSQDNQCHVCFSSINDERGKEYNTPFCVYLPGSS